MNQARIAIALLIMAIDYRDFDSGPSTAVRILSWSERRLLASLCPQAVI